MRTVRLRGHADVCATYPERTQKLPGAMMIALRPLWIIHAVSTRAQFPHPAHPCQHRFVTCWCGREFGVGKQPAVEVDDRGVIRCSVGVDATDDGSFAVRHVRPGASRWPGIGRRAWQAE
jgi:hypothetical protein